VTSSSEGRLGSSAAGSGHVLPTGGVAGYRPGRTLRLWVELRRQFKRRRTLGVYLLMAALPLILIGALHLGGGDNGRRNNVINLVDVATASGLNFTLFVLFAASGFFLVVVFALFFGDTVASEASWGSLRYSLAIPVPRNRLLRQKWYAALVLSVGALLTLVVVSLVAGGLTYGFTDVQTPVGFSMAQGTALVRLAGMVGYLAVHLLVVGALAFWLSTITDAPLAAVGGAVLLMILSAILDSIPALGDIRQGLPGHYAFAFMLGVLTDAPLAAVGGAVLLMILSAILDSITALGGIRQGLPGHYALAWADALAPTVNYSDMITGALWSVGYAIVLIGYAVWHFVRKDITS
jgi:ABC-2 type transport system permease protein